MPDTVRLPDPPWSVAIVERDGRPALRFQVWWELTTKTVEDAFARSMANDATLTEQQLSLAEVVANLEAALADIETLNYEVTTFQPKDLTLTALAALDGTPGLVEQTGVDAFGVRTIGVANGPDVPDRDAADSRYVQQDTGAFPSIPSYTAYTGQTVSNPPTQTEVQVVDNAAKDLGTAVAAIITTLTNLKTALDTANVLT